MNQFSWFFLVCWQSWVDDSKLLIWAVKSLLMNLGWVRLAFFFFFFLVCKFLAWVFFFFFWDVRVVFSAPDDFSMVGIGGISLHVLSLICLICCLIICFRRWKVHGQCQRVFFFTEIKEKPASPMKDGPMSLEKDLGPNPMTLRLRNRMQILILV